MNGQIIVFSILFVMVSISAFAADSVPMNHNGYLSEVESERQIVHRKLRVVAKPSDPSGPSLNDKIFNGRLKREFRNKYREKFGRTTTENLINSPNRYTRYSGLVEDGSEAAPVGNFRGNHLELYKENQRFGSFMFRRLTEYHVDKYMRDRPVVKKVYQLKEKYSRVNLQFSKRVRLKVRYQVAENSVRLQLENPWLKNKLLIEMDSAALGPSEVKESTLSLYFPTFLGVNLQGHYKAVENSYLLVGARRLTTALTANVTAHWNRNLLVGPLGTELIKEDLVLGGLNWSY